MSKYRQAAKVDKNQNDIVSDNVLLNESSPEQEKVTV